MKKFLSFFFYKFLVITNHPLIVKMFLIQDFQTVTIVLEVILATSDFYLFCWCQPAFRKKV